MATKVKSGVVDPSDDELGFLYGDYEPYTLTLTLLGVMPFLFNQNDNYAEEDPGEAKRPRKGPADPESMVWRKDEFLAVPAANVIASIAHAGRYFKTPIGARGSAKTTLQEAMMPVPEFDMATFDKKTWDAIDFRVARYAGQSRAPKPTWRPRLEKGWRLKAHLSVITPDIYSPTRILEIASHAGRVCGIGDGRKLGFGRFILDGVKTEKGLPW